MLKEGGARFAGRRVGDLDLRERTGCSIVAVERDGAPLATIGSELVLAEDDVLYVCGGDEGIDRFKQLDG